MAGVGGVTTAEPTSGSAGTVGGVLALAISSGFVEVHEGVRVELDVTAAEVDRDHTVIDGDRDLFAVACDAEARADHPDDRVAGANHERWTLATRRDREPRCTTLDERGVTIRFHDDRALCVERDVRVAERHRRRRCSGDDTRGAVIGRRNGRRDGRRHGTTANDEEHERDHSEGSDWHREPDPAACGTRCRGAVDPGPQATFDACPRVLRESLHGRSESRAHRPPPSRSLR